MFQKVLVPVDFSPKSHFALSMASQIAKDCRGEIDLFHVVQAALMAKLNELGEYESMGKSGQTMLTEVANANKKKLEKLAKQHRSDELSIKTRIKIDGMPDRVAQHIHQEDYDLLVLAGDLDRKLGESLGEQYNEKIVKLAKKPVLVVNQMPSEREIKKIVVPTNLTDDYGKQAEKLKAVQQFFDAEIVFMFINTPSYFYSTYQIDEMIQAFQEKHRFENCAFRILSDRDHKKGMLKAIEYLNADMVGLMSFQNTRLSKFFRGDITEHLVNHSSIPVMVLNVER